MEYRGIRGRTKNAVYGCKHYIPYTAFLFFCHTENTANFAQNIGSLQTWEPMKHKSNIYRLKYDI